MSEGAQPCPERDDTLENLDACFRAERSALLAVGQIRFDQDAAVFAHANVDPYAALALLR